MKFLLECLIAVFLHPVAFVLCLIHLAGRTDLNTTQKVMWGIVVIIWGIGPILYLLFGNGEFW